MDPFEFDWYKRFRNRTIESIVDLYDPQILWDITFDGNYDIAEADCIIHTEGENTRWSSIPGVLSELIVITEEVSQDVEKLQYAITEDYYSNNINAFVVIDNISRLEYAIEDFTHKATITITFPMMQNS